MNIGLRKTAKRILDIDRYRQHPCDLEFLITLQKIAEKILLITEQDLCAQDNPHFQARLLVAQQKKLSNLILRYEAQLQFRSRLTAQVGTVQMANKSGVVDPAPPAQEEQVFNPEAFEPIAVPEQPQIDPCVLFEPIQSAQPMRTNRNLW